MAFFILDSIPYLLLVFIIIIIKWSYIPIVL